jgi:thiamine pyrophosphate-dependent acetolactate synthase large subunit-like protein
MTGLIGFSSGYYAMRDCDVLLMLGASAPVRPSSPSELYSAQRSNVGNQTLEIPSRHRTSFTRHCEPHEGLALSKQKKSKITVSGNITEG